MKDRVVKFWGLGSAALLGLSVLMPWIQALGMNVGPMDGSDGPIILVAALIAVALLAWCPHKLPVRLYALIPAAIGLYEVIHIYSSIHDIRDEAEGFGALVSTGFGLYAAGLAALSLLVWVGYTFVHRRRAAVAPWAAA